MARSATDAELIDRLTDLSAGVRRAAALKLRLLFWKRRRIVESLTHQLEHSDDKCRAALALGAVRHKGAVKVLIGLLRSDNRDLRGAALEALGNIGDESAIEPIAAMLASEYSQSVCLSAISALARISRGRALEHLIALLRHNDIAVAAQAAFALAEMGRREAAPALIEALGRGAYEDQGIAYALGRLRAYQANERLLALAQGELRSSGSEACVQRAAIAATVALAQLGRREALPLMRQRLHLIEAASESKLPYDANRELRVVMVSALKKIGGPQAKELLEVLAQDRAVDVRQRALRALGRE